MLRNNLARFNSADSNTQRTAVHEAGHAVLAKQFGMTDVRGWVNYGTRRRSGTCSWRGKLTSFQWLIVAAAGAAAELAVLGDMGDEATLATDMQRARRAGWDRDQFLDAVYSLAEQIDIDAVMAQEITTRHYSNR